MLGALFSPLQISGTLLSVATRERSLSFFGGLQGAWQDESLRVCLGSTSIGQSVPQDMLPG